MSDAQFLINELNAAKTYFQNCVTSHASHANAFYYLGKIEQLSGSTDSSMKYFGKVLEINPDHRGARFEIENQGAEMKIKAITPKPRQ
jgi:predicted TPR repeat methyltransferase